MRQIWSRYLESLFELVDRCDFDIGQVGHECQAWPPVIKFIGVGLLDFDVGVRAMIVHRTPAIEWHRGSMDTRGVCAQQIPSVFSDWGFTRARIVCQNRRVAPPGPKHCDERDQLRKCDFGQRRAQHELKLLGHFPFPPEVFSVVQLGEFCCPPFLGGLDRFCSFVSPAFRRHPTSTRPHIVDVRGI